MKIIRSQRELANLAQLLEVRQDWHEPGEQGLTADWFGRKFDNAGDWPMPRKDMVAPDGSPLWDPEGALERYVVIYQQEGDSEPQPLAAVNLADLLAWASEPRS